MATDNPARRAEMKKPNIGVLALQGAVREHLRMLEDCGARGIAVRYPAELQLCRGLIIPGGESTTIGKLMSAFGFIDEIRLLWREGVPVYGTCAGLILMAKRIAEGGRPLLGLMDITARRNAFGRQVDSFETDLEMKGIAESNRPFRAVFIRAPWIDEAGPEVEVLGEFGGRVVAARQDGMLVTAFHPELTGDDRVHRYFLAMVEEASRSRAAAETGG